MFMDVELDIGMTAKEEEYFISYIMGISTFNYVKLNPESLAKFLHTITFSREGNLNREEKQVLALKMMQWVEKNEKLFIFLVMSSQATFDAVAGMGNSILGAYTQKVFEHALYLLKTNPSARQALVKDIHAIDLLYFIFRNHEQQRAQLFEALMEIHYFRQLFDDTKDLRHLAKKCPELTTLVMDEVLRDEVLFKRLIDTEEDLVKLQQGFPSLRAPEVEASIRKRIRANALEKAQVLSDIRFLFNPPKTEVEEVNSSNCDTQDARPSL